MKTSTLCWLAVTCLLVFPGGQTARADDQSPTHTATVANTNLSFSVVAPPEHAAWLQRFTLGPGDVLNFTLYNAPDTERSGVIIGPDGRVNYLQAHDVMAAGLTIDELRETLTKDLSKYYRDSHVIVTPSAFRSKKYYVLGAVASKGVYPFDHPLTVIEAVARAGGLETGMFEGRTMDMADLSHSFLVRDDKRVPVDFEKLFQDGDLSQNIALQPGDYLYFASASANEIYVLGSVASPGLQAYTPTATVISAVMGRGGFARDAFRRRVLVVRGSLNHPETFVVDTAAILSGKARDFRLQPKDIVYVNSRPWQKAEDLLNTAATAFLQSALVTWTGIHVDPLITSPVIK